MIGNTLRVLASGKGLLLRRADRHILGAPVEYSIGPIDSVGVADRAAGGPGGDRGEAQVRVDPGGGAVDGHSDLECVVCGGPEGEGGKVRPGILGGRGSGGEAGEEDSGDNNELHFETWI